MASFSRTMACAFRGARNYFFKKPFCASFEVTYRCNARCQHCHLGGPLEGEVRAAPERFGEIAREINPVVAQISGGEPLLRKDLEKIIEEIRVPGKDPFIVLTTNASLLSLERYNSLRKAGVDEFSISLDYPDERHDEFRNIPGLFKKIEKLLSQVQDISDKGITLSCVVHRKNFKELIKLAKFARRWNIGMNFSAYTWLRTNRKDDFMISEEEMPQFRDMIGKIIEFKRKNKKVVFTSEYNFRKMIEWFENQSSPDCRAGERFLIVGPDGTLSPCGLILKKYKSRKELIEDFTKSNTCELCFTSIRVNSEKKPVQLLRDNLKKAPG